MPVLMIAIVDVHDTELLAEYSALARPTLAEFGGKPLAVDNGARPLEGELPGKRAVVIEFPDEETAQRWYDSEAYQAAADVRKKAATSGLILVDAL